jgi:hypothetical protein
MYPCRPLITGCIRVRCEYHILWGVKSVYCTWRKSTNYFRIRIGFNADPDPSFTEPKGGAGSWEPNQCRSTFPTGIRIQDSQMNADPDPQQYLKRRDQRAFNLRNWRTSVYSTAYYIFFCSSAAGWHVRVRYVYPVLKKKFACNVCPVYSYRVLTEKSSFLNMKNQQIVILF